MVLDCLSAPIVFLLPIKMQCVFATLIDNLFSSSHVFSDSKSLLTTLLMVESSLRRRKYLYHQHTYLPLKH